ncbi:MAG: fimbrillin family protein, partial [Rikenellaceae bacterium]|nr:fimbrillin family protein [Rikenellaceae bacterium]
MKQYLLVAVALLAVVGCQRRPLGGDDPAGEACLVRFQAKNEVEVDMGSKAATSSNLPAGSTVRVVAYQRGSAGQTNPNLASDTWKETSTYKVQGDGSLVPCHVTADGAVDAGNANPAKGMELNNGVYDFYAYSPARQLESDHKSVKGVGHYEDFMGAYVGSQTINRSSSTVALVFEHKCTKLSFTVKSVNGMVCSDLFADSAVVRQMATVPAGDYTLGGDLAATVGAAADTGIIRTFSYLDAAQKGNGAFGSAIFLPKAAGEVPAEFYIKVNGVRYLLKAKLPSIVFAKSNNYMFTLRVKQGEVELTLKVASWSAVAQNSELGA